jgi:hypothetical protein
VTLLVLYENNARLLFQYAAETPLKIKNNSKKKSILLEKMKLTFTVKQILILLRKGGSKFIFLKMGENCPTNSNELM